MKFHFFHQHTNLVGLAIGDTHIRALQLKGALASAQLEGFGEVELPKGTFNSEGKVDADGLARALENLLAKPQKGRFTSKDVAVNLPEAKCFVRVIHVSEMSDAEIDAAVPFEAESYIPVPIDQVYLDWQRLGAVDGRVELLLVASPKDFVDAVLSGVQQAGLTPVSLEVQSLCLARALVAPGTAESMLIVDMKGSGTDLVMVERGHIQFSSTIPIAGASITDAVAKGLDVPPKRAEEIKAIAGFGNTEEYPNLKTLLLPVMNSLVAEIKQVMTFHAQHSSERITKVLLVGGSARLKGLTEFLTESLGEKEGLVVQLAGPTVNVHVALPEELDGDKILPYAAAVGLAMKGLTE